MAAWHYFVEMLFIDIDDLATMFVGAPVGFVCASFVMHLLMSRARMLKASDKLATIKYEGDDCVDEPKPSEKQRVSEFDGKARREVHKVRNQGLALLEQYGAFGAAPGAWTASLALSEEDEDLEETAAADPKDWSEACVSGMSVASTDVGDNDVLDDETEFVHQSATSRRSPIRGDGLALLEHYGVFGAAPGTWSSPRSPPCPLSRNEGQKNESVPIHALGGARKETVAKLYADINAQISLLAVVN